MSARIKPGGVGLAFGPDAVVEVETSTCAHCQRITDIPSRRQMQNVVDVCRNCMRLICDECAGKPCTPIMKKIEAMEEAYYRRRQMAMAMGLEA